MGYRAMGIFPFSLQPFAYCPLPIACFIKRRDVLCQDLIEPGFSVIQPVAAGSEEAGEWEEALWVWV